MSICTNRVDHALSERVSTQQLGLSVRVVRRGEAAEQIVERFVRGDDLAHPDAARAVRNSDARVRIGIAHAEHDVALLGFGAEPHLDRQELIE
jgi:hypothetical protein